MRWPLLLGGAITGTLASCAPLPPGQTREYGFVWLVSHDDIRAAIAEDEPLSNVQGNRIAFIQVMSRNEMHIYHHFGVSMYDEFKRVGGKWRCTAIVLRE
jgi:hypothetical protein